MEVNLGYMRVAVGPGHAGSSHSGLPASNFPLIGNIIYIPSLGVKVQSDIHYPSKDNFSL